MRRCQAHIQPWQTQAAETQGEAEKRESGSCGWNKDGGLEPGGLCRVAVKWRGPKRRREGRVGPPSCPLYACTSALHVHSRADTYRFIFTCCFHFHSPPSIHPSVSSSVLILKHANRSTILQHRWFKLGAQVVPHATRFHSCLYEIYISLQFQQKKCA